MTGVADQDHLAAGAGVAADFQVNLGDQRAGSVEDLRPRRAACSRTARDTPWALKITVAPSGTLSSSSTNTAPRWRKSSTTKRLWTTSWRT